MKTLMKLVWVVATLAVFTAPAIAATVITEEDLLSGDFEMDIDDETYTFDGAIGASLDVPLSSSGDYVIDVSCTGCSLDAGDTVLNITGGVASYYAIRVIGAADATISNLGLTNGRISISGHVDFENLVFNRTAFSGEEGIRMESSGSVSFNRCQLLSTGTVQALFQARTGSQGSTFESCLLISQRYPIEEMGGVGGALSINNTTILSVGAGDRCIQSYRDAGTAVITNSILDAGAGGDEAIIFGNANWSGLTMDNNMVHSTHSTWMKYNGTSYGSSTISGVDTNVLTHDPAYVDNDGALTGDYVLDSGDAGVDAGNNSYRPAAQRLALYGDPRWVATIDIGGGENLVGETVGACCSGWPVPCSIQTSATCTTYGWTYQGNGTDCDPDPCPTPATGACCAFDGTCTVLTEYYCDLAVGTYEGDATVCSPNPCAAPTTGACCTEVSGVGTCNLTTEVGCTEGFFYGLGVNCTPNPCPSWTEINPYKIRPEHPRLVDPDFITSIQALYNGGTIDPSVPTRIQTVWAQVVSEADDYLADPIDDSLRSYYVYTALAGAYLLTGNSAYPTKLEAIIADDLDYGYNPDVDSYLWSFDICWNGFTDSFKDDLVNLMANKWGDGVDGISAERKQSGAMNLYGNYAYYALWAIICWGEATTTYPEYQTWAALAMDEGWDRFNGEEGFYPWVDNIWPDFMGYGKGASYATKYTVEAAIVWPYVCYMSGLDSTQVTKYEDTLLSEFQNYQLWQTRADYKYIRGFPGATQGMTTTREIFGAGMRMMLGTNNTLSDSLNQQLADWGAPWQIGDNDYLWGSCVFTIHPDSIEDITVNGSSFNPDYMPRYLLTGNDGEDRVDGTNTWYEWAIARWGSQPWELSDGDGGHFAQTAGMLIRDNFGTARQGAYSLYYDGPLINPTGKYEGSEHPDQYPYYFGYGPGQAVPIVHLSTGPTEAQIDAGISSITDTELLSSVGHHGYHFDPAEPANQLSEFLAGSEADPANMVAMGADTTSIPGHTFLYTKVKYNPTAIYFSDSRKRDVEKLERYILLYAPARSGERALLMVRDVAERDTPDVADGMWSSIPCLRPVVSGGSGVTEWVEDKMLDYQSFDYVSVSNDTLDWSAYGRITPIAGTNYMRYIYGASYEQWAYQDVRSPLATGVNYASIPDDNRWVGFETGGGRIELHAANGASSMDITYLVEANSLDDQGLATASEIEWAVVEKINSETVIGALVDTTAIVMPKSPDGGGPWSFRIETDTSLNMVIPGLPDGNYTVDPLVGSYTSADSLLVINDVDGNETFTVSIAVGACCYADGTCEIVGSDLGCESPGAYQGDGSVCDPNPCSSCDCDVVLTTQETKLTVPNSWIGQTICVNGLVEIPKIECNYAYGWTLVGCNPRYDKRLPQLVSLIDINEPTGGDLLASDNITISGIELSPYGGGNAGVLDVQSDEVTVEDCVVRGSMAWQQGWNTSDDTEGVSIDGGTVQSCSLLVALQETQAWLTTNGNDGWTVQDFLFRDNVVEVIAQNDVDDAGWEARDLWHSTIDSNSISMLDVAGHEVFEFFGSKYNAIKHNTFVSEYRAGTAYYAPTILLRSDGSDLGSYGDTIAYNHIENDGKGISITQGHGHVIVGNEVFAHQLTSWAGENSQFALTYSPEDAPAVDDVGAYIADNILVVGGNSKVFDIGGYGFGRFVNNSVRAFGTSRGCGAFASPNGSWEIYNNSFEAANPTVAVVEYNFPSIGQYENNLYYFYDDSNGGGLIRYQNTDTYELYEWQALDFSPDQNSIQASADVNNATWDGDASTAPDFTPRLFSPLIDAGEDSYSDNTLSVRDVYGNIRKQAGIEIAAAEAISSGGACCLLDDNLCVWAGTAGACSLLEGEYQGDGVACEPSPCAGACCDDDQVCTFVSRSNCSAQGGTFLGWGETCSPNPCREPKNPEYENYDYYLNTPLGR